MIMNSEQILWEYGDVKTIKKVYLKGGIIYGLFLQPVLTSNEPVIDATEFQFILKENLKKYSNTVNPEERQKYVTVLTVADITDILILK